MVSDPYSSPHHPFFQPIFISLPKLCSNHRETIDNIFSLRRLHREMTESEGRMSTSDRVEISGEILIKQGAEACAYISHLLPFLPQSSASASSLQAEKHVDSMRREIQDLDLLDAPQGTTTTTSFTTAGPRCVRKHRPRKPYRHPVLDARLTRARILAESRLLQKLRRSGVAVPAVLFVDEPRGDLWMEYIPGPSVRDYLFAHTSPDPPSSSSTSSDHPFPQEKDSYLSGTGRKDEDEEERERGKRRVEGVMRRIGLAVAHMHANDVVHGDLTTSNLLLRNHPPPPPSSSSSTIKDERAGTIPRDKGNRIDVERRDEREGGGDEDEDDDDEEDDDDWSEVVMIDFGLGSVSLTEEDKAVDLYVLERAFLSTHPHATHLFSLILDAYGSFDHKTLSSSSSPAADDHDSSGGTVRTKTTTTTTKGDGRMVGKRHSSRLVLKRLAKVRLRGRKRTMVG